MAFLKAHDQPYPSISELYVAGVMATFPMMLSIISLSALREILLGGEIGWAAGVVFFGGMYGIFFAVIGGFLVFGPLVALIGSILVRFTKPGWWQGAVTGILTALPLLVLINISRRSADGEAVFVGTFLAVAAFIGWIMQRHWLHWPSTTDA